MNEAIGAKGGHRDRLRIKKIKRKKQKSKKVKDKELEKIVKKNQKYTLVKTVPIVVLGGTIKTLYDVSKVKDDKKSIDEFSIVPDDKKKTDKDNKKAKKIDVNGKKVIVEVTDNIKKGDKPKKKEKEKNIKEDKSVIGDSFLEGKKEEDYNVNSDFETSIIDEAQLSLNSQMKLQKLKSRKIVSLYEKQLKDIRYDLRHLIFEYNVLVDDQEKIILAEEAKIILDKLSEIIEKMEILKNKIQIENLDKYDDNYIYTLVEGYLEEFKDKKIVKEIKDSPLYILISSKLDELDTKKDSLKKKVEDKKEDLEDKEKDFEKLKDNYVKMSKINDEMERFQLDQERLLRTAKEKVDEAVTIEEKIRVEFEVADVNTRRLMRIMAASLFFPGPRVARGMAASTAAYLYFLNNMLRPNMVTKKYKEISVMDYTDSIKSNIEALDDAKKLLGKTSKQIDKMIKDIKEDYSDYLGVIRECDDLLRNLGKIKEEIKEKEYEMEKIKEEQVLVLERNNAKIKTRGTYQM